MARKIIRRTGIVAFVLSFLFSAPEAKAQDVGEMVKSHRIYAGYFGNNAIRPGLMSGSELTLKTNTKNKESRKFFFGKKIPRTHTKQWTYNTVSFMYLHPRSHLALGRNWGIGYRKTRTKGWEYSFDIYPVGVQFNLMGETFEVSDDGDVNRKGLNLSAYYTPAIAGGFGKQIKKKEALDAWFVKLHVNGLANYNNTFVPTANLVLALRLDTFKLFEKYGESES